MARSSAEQRPLHQSRLLLDRRRMLSVDTCRTDRAHRPPTIDPVVLSKLCGTAQWLLNVCVHGVCMDAPHTQTDSVDALDPDRPELLGRRRMLSIMGGAGLAGVAAVAAACSSGDPATVATTTTAANSSTTSTTSTTASGASPSTSAVDSTSCSEIPTETAGPYPGDGSNGKQVLTIAGVVRRDITTSFGGATGSVSGVPLTVNFDVLDVANGCEPLSGAAVYAWHCCADGKYSMYSAGATDQNWLRGVQITGGLPVVGNQGGILVGRRRVAGLDCRRDAPVQVGTIRSELRFVGHRANQRVVERVSGGRRELHLIDQLGCQQ